MTVTADTSTGHVGNLTPDQDAKLRELWILLFNSTASVLSTVYQVPLPKGPPSKLFEVLDKIHEPTAEAIIHALKEEEGKERENGTTENGTAPAETGGDGEKKEQKSLDKMESLLNDREAQQNIMKEMSTRKVTSAHFASLFAQLRKMGVSESEIKSMEELLSHMTPGEMCFGLLKMIKQEHPDSLLLRFLRARKWDVGKAYAMMMSNMLWRKQDQVDDDIEPKGELFALEQSKNEKLSAKERKEGKDFIDQHTTGKSFLHGFDRQGRPVNYVRVRIHKPGAQSEEALERYIVHVIESTRLIVVPPVETGVCPILHLPTPGR